jgi:hypothetical protein
MRMAERAVGEVMPLGVLCHASHDVEAPPLKGEDGRKGIEGDIGLPDEAVLFAAVVVVILDVRRHSLAQLLAPEPDNLAEIPLVLVRQEV